MKKLPDLDRGNPFYSDEADKAWTIKRKRLEKEEQEMIDTNRRAYRSKSKKEERGMNGDKEISKEDDGYNPA